MIIVYDPDYAVWELLMEVPTAYLAIQKPAIGIDQDTLYLMGGVNCRTDEIVSDVLCYALEDDTWKTVASLSEPSYGGTALQVDGEMILTLNETESGTSLSPWHFDGTAWRISSAAMPEISPLAYYDVDGNCRASVCAYENTLLYTGLPTDTYGDIFCYRAEDETFVKNDYTVYGLSQENLYCTAVMDTVLYVLCTPDFGLETALIPLEGDLPSDGGDSENTDSGNSTGTQTAAQSSTNQKQTTTKPSTSKTTQTTDFDALTVTLGDVDFDDAVTIEDAYAVLCYYSRQSAGLQDNFLASDTFASRETAALTAADVDEDGKITIQDAYHILMYYASRYAGIEITWEVVLSA